MESVVTLAICILASIFVGSFISLVLLCRHNTLRKSTAKYVRKLGKPDQRSDKDLVMEEALGGRCLALLGLCRSLDLLGGNITVSHLNTLKHIVQVARSITEESEAGEKEGLLQPHTTSLVLQASRTLAAMEHKLMTLKEESAMVDFAQSNPVHHYQTSVLI